MKNKQILWLMIIGLLCISGCSGSSKSIYVKLSVDSLAYGSVFLSDSSELSFKIINESSKVYDITDVLILGNDAAEFTITSGWAGLVTVQPETELEITVEFTPISTGTKDVHIEISHSYAKEESPVILKVSAESVVDAELQSTPAKYHYGFIPVGSSNDKDFVLKNVGGDAIDISEIAFVGEGESSYEILSGWDGSPFKLSSGTERTVSVRFSPNSDGEKIVKMRVTHNGSNSPLDVDLTGGGGFGYIKEEFALGMTSIRNTGTEITTDDYLDDEYYNFNLGFTFTYFGQEYSTIWVCENGWVSFGQDPGDPFYENFALPASNVSDSAIYPFWDDVEFNKSDVPDAKWVYEIQDDAPNRIFVVEWYKLNRYNTAPVSVATYQLRLYETSNIIEFHYSENVDEWANSAWTATIGLQDANTGNFLEIAGSPSISKQPTVNYRFVP